MSRPGFTLRACASAIALGAICALSAPAAGASTGCDRIASPGGSDAAQQLVESLAAGQTGCLRAGTYTGGMTFRNPGVTIRAYPGEKVTVLGLVYVAQSAPRVSVAGLYLNGRGLDHPSPTINANDVTFRGNDVTNDHSGICFMLGDSHGEWGRADRAVIERNRVHDCGELPATNLHHGIYIEATTGARIEGNWFYDNADFGVHLYPDADRTLVRGNVIDGNGKGLTISADGGQASDGNVITGNVISNSKLRFNVEAWWPSGNPVPRDNLVARNCLKAGPVDWHHHGGVDMESAKGFTLRANEVVGNPGFANRARRDFRLPAGTACRSTFYGDPLAVPGPDSNFGAIAAARPRRPQVRLKAARRKLRRGQRVRLRGKVQSGAAAGRKASIYARGKGGRRLLARVKISSRGRFSVKRRLRLRGRVVRVRAVVEGVGRSRPVRLRVTA